MSSAKAAEDALVATIAKETNAAKRQTFQEKLLEVRICQPVDKRKARSLDLPEFARFLK